MKRDEERHVTAKQERRGEGNLAQRGNSRIDEVLGRVRDGEVLAVRGPPRGEMGAYGGEATSVMGDPRGAVGAEPPEIPDYVDALDEEREVEAGRAACDGPLGAYVVGQPQPVPGTAPPPDETLRRWVQRAVAAEKALVEVERELAQRKAENAEAARTIEDQAGYLYLERNKSAKLEAMVATHDRASVDVAEALGKVIRELREELGWRRRRGPMDITAARIQVLSLMVDKLAGWPFDTFMMKCEALARWAVDGPGEDESNPEDVG